MSFENFKETDARDLPLGRLVGTISRAHYNYLNSRLKDLNINLPSATCIASIPLISELHGTSGEPGHGLTGTTRGT